MRISEKFLDSSVAESFLQDNALPTALLDEIAGVLCRYLVLSLVEIEAISLWILHTYAIEASSISPLLIVTSAEKRCGKTLLRSYF